MARLVERSGARALLVLAGALWTIPWCGCSLSRQPLSAAPDAAPSPHDATVEMDAPHPDDADRPDVSEMDAPALVDAPVIADAPPSCPTLGPTTLIALPAGPITVDGLLSDWGTLTTIALTAPSQYVQELSRGTSPAADGADLSVALDVRWTATTLYFAAEVTDDRHRGSDLAASLDLGDSLIVGFDVALNGGASYDATDDFVYGFAVSPTAVVHHTRLVAPPSAGADSSGSSVVRAGSSTRYEIAIPAVDLGLSSFSLGAMFGFAFVVVENDFNGGEPRDGYLEWTSDVGLMTPPSGFGTLALSGPPCP